MWGGCPRHSDPPFSWEDRPGTLRIQNGNGWHARHWSPIRLDASVRSPNMTLLVELDRRCKPPKMSLVLHIATVGALWTARDKRISVVAGSCVPPAAFGFCCPI